MASYVEMAGSIAELFGRCWDCGDRTDVPTEHPERRFLYCPPCRLRRRNQQESMDPPSFTGITWVSTVYP